MSQPIVFALSRFRSFMDAQSFIVLIFEGEGIRLVDSKEAFTDIAFAEIESAEFVHMRTQTPGWMEPIGGFFTRPKEDIFRFQAGGNRYELSLEIDSHHRKQDVRDALERMYRAGVKLFERTGSRKPTFLLVPMSAEEIERERAKLTP